MHTKNLVVKTIKIIRPYKEKNRLIISPTQEKLIFFKSLLGDIIIFSAALMPVVIVIFIMFFIAKDAFPFLKTEGIKHFFVSTDWRPTHGPGDFGALAIITGSLVVTVTASLFSVPIGIISAICLSDILPFKIRQTLKPIIEIMASIPSVAYGFFALVVLAPLLQKHGGQIISMAFCLISLPVVFIITLLGIDMINRTVNNSPYLKQTLQLGIVVIPSLLIFWGGYELWQIKIYRGTNALNVSFILAIMALPTIISVSEDALQATGKELREASYGLGATRAETLIKVIIPAAASGILAAVILGVMRALGETMVVWMAAGNALSMPSPVYDLTQQVKTLTATIAGEMGETPHTTDSTHYTALFFMAFFLLIVSFISNLFSEKIIQYNRNKLKGRK